MYIDNTIYEGRPQDCLNRNPSEVACYDLLDSLNIDYKRIDHEAAHTIAMCEEVEKLIDIKICKNLFLTNRQKSKFYLLLMAGNKPFKTKFLSKQIGTSRLSFASPEDMVNILGVTPGSATVLSLMNDKEHKVTLVLDSSVSKDGLFGCHPCINTSSIFLSMKDVINTLLPNLDYIPVFVDLPIDEE